jgi:hypothetical protein
MTLLPNGDGKSLVDNEILKLMARLFQVIGVPVMCIILASNLATGAAQRERIETTLSDLNTAIKLLQQKTDHIYTQDDANKDLQLENERMTNMGSRITELSGHVDDNTHRIGALEAARNRYPHR